MKTTPFTDHHIALGAKMHEFAGYNMPIEYSGIIDEHLTVVNAVVCSYRTWVSSGERTKALSFLQQIAAMMQPVWSRARLIIVVCERTGRHCG